MMTTMTPFICIAIHVVYLYSCSAMHHGSVNIVSIVDESSKLSCLAKIHSVISSSRRRTELSFKFLLINSSLSTMESWDEGFKQCFPGFSFETKIWKRPRVDDSSDLDDRLLARLYLANIFDDINYFIYLDNDLIVTADLLDLYQQGMVAVSSQQLSHPTNKKRQYISSTSPLAIRMAPIAFVFEQHPSYKNFIVNHFNTSHILVQRAISIHGTDVFLNTDVALVDAKRWRNDRWTQRAEMIMSVNRNNSIYNCKTGDQGVFYVLLQEHVAYLPARFNMRRVPKKTVVMLSDERNLATGIVHFSGSVDPCSNPLKYSLYHSAVTPLYLSVISSLADICPNSIVRVPQNCVEAIQTFQEAIVSLNISVKYNSGLGQFTWPPNSFFKTTKKC